MSSQPVSGLLALIASLTRSFWTEAKITVEAEDLDLDGGPEVPLDLGEKGLHRRAHLLFVHLPVGFEERLAVVALQAVKEL